MSEDQFKQLIALLQQTGTFAYQSAVQYVVSSNIIWLIWNLTFIVISALVARALWLKLRKSFKEIEVPDKDEKEAYFFGRAAIIAVLSLFSFISLCFARNNIVSLLAPYYTAIQALTDLIN